MLRTVSAFCLALCLPTSSLPDHFLPLPHDLMSFRLRAPCFVWGAAGSL